MKKLLIPIDFSPNSINALAFGLKLAEHLDIPATVLHVTRLKIRTNFSAVHEINRLEKELVENARQQLNDVIQQHASDTSAEVKPLVRLGLFLDEVLHLTENGSHDAIVMGSSGENSGAAKVFGTNVNTLLANAACPLFIIPPSASFKAFERIAFTSRFDDIHEKELRFVVELARRFQALVYVLDIEAEDLPQSQLDALGEELRAKYEYEHIEPKLYVDKDVMHGIEASVQVDGIDLLTLVMRERSFLKRIVSPSLSQKAVHKPTVPLLGIHE